jgi:uncharacterized protein YrzB (UPF0473 family)
MSANKTKDEISEEEDGEPMFVTLEYDDGTEVETEVMGVFEVEGKEYIALIPDDGSDDVYLYGYQEIGGEDGEEFELIDIEDEAEFDKVVEAFDELMGFEDEEEE